MHPLSLVSDENQRLTKRLLLCCGCAGLTFISLLSIGFLPKLDAAENVFPQVTTSPALRQMPSKLATSYARLPLSFEKNQGQMDSRIRFLAHGKGYSIFLTDEGVVLTLRESSVVGRQLSEGEKQNPGIRIPEAAADWDRESTQYGSAVAGSTVRMSLVGANADATVTGTDELPGKTNYYIGNDPKKWRTNIPNYGQVKFKNVYPGVDLVYYGNQRQLEYDFVLAPGADPDQIKMSFAGTDHLRVDAASGDLVLKVGNGEVRFHKPNVYQPSVATAFVASPSGFGDRHSSHAALPSSFVLAGNNEVAFQVAGYDPRRALVIDPVLSYSTYLGGSNEDASDSLAIDPAGNAYITGFTISTNFPTVNAIQTQCASCAGATPAWDAFMAKLNPAGSALVYSTYLGGSSNDYGVGIAADAAGNAYITGSTTSTDFPTTANAFETTSSGLGDAFVAKLSATGSLDYSTFLHIAQGQSIAVDGSGNAYVTGATSNGFPTANAFQPSPGGGTDAFVTKLNPTGTALVYSTFLGGSAEDGGRGIAIDAAGDAYVTGFTKSTDFPTSHPLQAASGGGTCGTGTQTYNCPDAFVAELNPAGSALVYSTYLGGSDQDFGNSIAVDSAGGAYIAGYTLSTDFPTVNPLQSQCDNCSTVNGTNGPVTSGDAFVAKINSAGSALAYSTYLGGSADDQALSIAVDTTGNAYVAGETYSTDFPTVDPIPNVQAPMENAFVTELNPTGLVIVYSTFLSGSGGAAAGGIAVDASDNAYVFGTTSSTDFPTVNPIQATLAGSGDVFVAKISAGGAAPSLSPAPVRLVFSPQNTGTTSAAQAVTVTNTGAADLNIATVAFGGTNAGDFGPSADNCAGATVAPNDTCTVDVTFTPTAPQARSATLIFTDNASGSPQTIELSGSGPDFTLALPPSSSSTATVGPGQTATYTLSMGGEGGLSGTMNFTCTGAPHDAVCAVTPNPATIGNAPSTITVKVTTEGPSEIAPRSRPIPPVPPKWRDMTGLMAIALILAALAFRLKGRKPAGVRGWQSAMAPLVMGILLILALTECGGGNGGGGFGPPVITDPGTPNGTFMLTVTGTAGSGATAVSHIVTLTLDVT